MIEANVETRQEEVRSGPIRKVKCSKQKTSRKDTNRSNDQRNHGTSGNDGKGRCMSKQEFNRYMTNWLRDNFFYPYPDHDGIDDMARISGRARTTILNWLNNNRSRKWYSSMENVFKLNRPSDTFYEDCLNMFDGKPLRDLSTFRPMSIVENGTNKNDINDEVLTNTKIGEINSTSNSWNDVIGWTTTTEPMDDLDSIPEVTEYRDEKEKHHFVYDSSSSCRLSLPDFSSDILNTTYSLDCEYSTTPSSIASVNSFFDDSVLSTHHVGTSTFTEKKNWKKRKHEMVNASIDKYFTSKLDDLVLENNDFDDFFFDSYSPKAKYGNTFASSRRVPV